MATLIERISKLRSFGKITIEISSQSDDNIVDIYLNGSFLIGSSKKLSFKEAFFSAVLNSETTIEKLR